ncbi:ribonuclease E inhibitor RraA/Dimethylmenaquinone methyltransferase [Rhexocercosporidium sp. MPI-PUGE-AT-0058]|nr:ribonuclease E inhibitor RraA/Dimethylmenaquinone methyltransferase [Rhexocercosporidium sp. MPI-PUGE-AT-0058]
MANDPITAQLQNFTSCDVSDALLKLAHPHGGFLSGLTLWSPQRQAGETKIAGRAYTVKYVLNSETEAPKLEGHYIDSVPQGAVIFVSSPKVLNAVYGGLMTHRARASGAVGTVVDGRIRDLGEHREQGFPVFARDVGTASPYESVKVSAINVPVKLQSEDQDVTIHPGDYLIGDLDGVVCLPQELAEKVLELMPSQVKADVKVAEDLDRGVKFAEASKKHRAGVKKP